MSTNSPICPKCQSPLFHIDGYYDYPDTCEQCGLDFNGYHEVRLGEKKGLLPAGSTKKFLAEVGIEPKWLV